MKALPLLILACSLSTATPSSLATARGYLPSERFPRGQLFAKPWGPLRHLPPAPRLILRLGLRGGGGMSGDEQVVAMHAWDQAPLRRVLRSRPPPAVPTRTVTRTSSRRNAGSQRCVTPFSHHDIPRTRTAADGSELDEMGNLKPGTGAAPAEEARQPWAVMTDEDPAESRQGGAMGRDEQAQNLGSKATVKVSAARHGQEVALDAEAWTGRVHAPAGAHITGQLGPQGQAPQLNGQWLVKDGGGGGIKGAEMTLDAPLSRGREERSTEYFREVALVQVHGGEWALENCTIACRHGVSIMAGGIAHDAANVKIDRCAVGGLYDAHVRREFYQFRIREVEDVMSAKDVDAELTLMEQDVVLAGGAAAGLWGRGNSTFVVADSMFQYAAVSANEIIRDDKNASLHHHSVEYDDSDFGVGDAQYAAYMQRLTEVLLNDNSTSDYILTEALPLPPRPRKKDPLPVGSAVFMQDRTRCKISNCLFKRNDVGITVDDYAHMTVENCTMLSAHYGFVDVVEWGIPMPGCNPPDLGATVELAGNNINGRLWASANIPRETRVLRRNRIVPAISRPDFLEDCEFDEDRMKQRLEEAKQAREDKEMAEQETPSDLGEPDPPAVQKWELDSEGLEDFPPDEDLMMTRKTRERLAREAFLAKYSAADGHSAPIDPFTCDIDIVPAVLSVAGVNNTMIDAVMDKLTKPEPKKVYADVPVSPEEEAGEPGIDEHYLSEDSNSGNPFYDSEDSEMSI